MNNVKNALLSKTEVKIEKGSRMSVTSTYRKSFDKEKELNSMVQLPTPDKC